MRRVLRGSAVVIIALLGILLVAAVFLNSYNPRSSSSGNPPGGNPPVAGTQCRGTAACFTDTVTHIVDGDTLDVGGIRIRLTLVNSPEVGQPGYAAAKQFTNQTCPVGTQALVDEDDGQTGGSYGRMVALVFCQGTNLNAELLRTGNAVLVPNFCAVSEFARDAWTGCP
jgi:micrococcal nuclease